MDRNEVILAGRLPDLAQIKTLQSGTRFGTWRLIVRRRNRGRGTRVDTIPCVSFEPEVVRSVTEWLPDDVVEVVGSLRRRWWGSQDSKASGYEVEVRSVKRLERRVTTVLTGDGELSESPPPTPDLAWGRAVDPATGSATDPASGSATDRSSGQAADRSPGQATDRTSGPVVGSIMGAATAALPAPPRPLHSLVNTVPVQRPPKAGPGPRAIPEDPVPDHAVTAPDVPPGGGVTQA
ncbi:hypothetical protein GCM10010156_15240 [Planobispora rosea]|uniref:Single-stranded DNA-binding protein n=1 Tax=Planobispora rosea TaxID=35762 RepID=A0A8J3WBR5_PLARO|nr:hypothetical protein GCM10010156_15240 [Planobispora rosea]GIH83405.1 hypothetical protein Pro02_18130 [Planobispora rosea]